MATILICGFVVGHMGHVRNNVVTTTDNGNFYVIVSCNVSCMHTCRESLKMNVLAVKEMIALGRKMKKLAVSQLSLLSLLSLSLSFSLSSSFLSLSPLSHMHIIHPCSPLFTYHQPTPTATERTRSRRSSTLRKFTRTRFWRC